MFQYFYRGTIDWNLAKEFLCEKNNRCSSTLRLYLYT